ncbi:MAG: zinc ribbon domain-containing protein [Clostridiales bacterium]|uniref:zinc ribbon domain-containing protein n=1 Tax=Provencibacterium massiliense TaxID=1841868 RepID=UPI0009A740FC|nr:zinc ribbon domain-containing protein [Provencibacterium massiliense]PWM38520.1 MAG: zinc ribbon domain-containing protein [Clostridiales bacterium]RGB64699.1 zinc ribbon domain-containing protein [Harryflintia acetispora]
MGTLDSIFNKARDVANDMGKKAGDVVEVSKLKLSVVSLESDIEKIYAKLGLMVYEMVKAGSENRGLIDGCVAEIDALKGKLGEINAKVDELKNVRRCDSCGAAVELSAQFCPMCGNLIKSQPEAEAAPQEEAAPEEPQPLQEPENPGVDA